MIDFSPKKEGQEVKEILHDGQNVMKSGLESKPDQEIENVTIVIGSRKMTWEDCQRRTNRLNSQSYEYNNHYSHIIE